MMAEKGQIPRFALTIWLRGLEKNPLTITVAAYGTAEEVGEQFGRYLRNDKCLTLWSLDKPGMATVAHGRDILRIDVQLLERTCGQADHED
jgi:hypothetical protein